MVKTFGRLLELACGHDLVDERIKNAAFIELIVTTEQCTSFAADSDSSGKEVFLLYEIGRLYTVFI